MSAFGAGCDDKTQEQAGQTIEPVTVNGEIAAFLNENLHSILHDDIGGEDFCMQINDLNQLPEENHAGEPFEYPDMTGIDFDTHTLVLGYYAAANGGWNLTGKELVADSDKMTMYLSIDKTANGTPTFIPKTFWGLYPKLASKPINVIHK